MKFEYKCLKSKSYYAFKIKGRIYYINCRYGCLLKDMKHIINCSDTIEEMVNWFSVLDVHVYRSVKNEEMKQIFEEKKWK